MKTLEEYQIKGHKFLKNKENTANLLPALVARVGFGHRNRANATGAQLGHVCFALLLHRRVVAQLHDDVGSALGHREGLAFLRNRAGRAL